MKKNKTICSICGEPSIGYDEKWNYAWCEKHEHIPPRYVECAIIQYRDFKETAWDKYYKERD